ncbi:MAG: hypothetical protein ACYSX0_03155 [Planctomycetota bacterium]|jgi:tetratricopeptide (TPR) repeat protein
MVRSLALLALAAALVHAEEETPEPGPVSTLILRLGELVIPPRPGDADRALEVFVAAHAAHKKDDLDGALAGYLEFLGVKGRTALPARYERTVKERLDALLARIRKRYDAAVKLYEKDRKKGLARARLIAERYPMLPEGNCALALLHSDGLHQAMADARALVARDKKAKKQAAESLQKAIRLFPAALYRYEAKSLLIDLGGPDLLKQDERVGKGDDEEPKKSEKDADDEESIIEVGD